MHWSDLLSRIGDWIAYTFMPLVMCYHLLTANVFLNTASTDAQGLERWGNAALVPFQYLFAGKIAIPCRNDETFHYVLKQRFDYHNDFWTKTAGSVIALPFSLIAGTTLKGLAMLSEDGRARHAQIARCESPDFVRSPTEYYHSLGIVPEIPSEKALSQGYARNPNDSHHLKWEKEALRQITEILEHHRIPFWVDCGTCLGAYRYGGVIPWDVDVDIGVLQPDFQNIKNALHALDREQFLVQDWSSRLRPETYLKVYVRQTRTYIDIYHFAIHPEQKMVQYILSNEDSVFMPSSWAKRERRFTVETPFDYVFPCKTISFDGIDVPIPNQTYKYLQMRYGENLDPVNIYNPQTEKYEKDPSHPYWQLPYVYQ